MEIENSCHLCGALVHQNGVSLLDPHNEFLAAWIVKNLGLQINKDNKFPDKICDPCVEDINMLNYFEVRCTKAHEIFTEQIKSENLETNSTREPDIVPVDEEFDRENEIPHSITQQDLNIQESDFYKNMQLKELTVSISKLTDKEIEKYTSKTLRNSNKSVQDCAISVRRGNNSKSWKNVDSSFSNTQLLLCNFCKYKVAKKESLYLHICKHLSIPTKSKITKPKRGIKKFKCKFCSSKFVREYKLFIHEKTCQGSNKRPFVCKECTYVSCKTSLDLEKHMKIHENEEEIVCDYCGITCRNESERLNHVSKRHGMLHHCMFCTYTSGDRRKVVTHNEIHLNNDYELKLSKRKSEFSCVYCEQDFDNKEERNIHSNLEHGKFLPYLCEFCGIRFHPFGLYKHHIRIRHSGHNFIYCKFCPKEFRTQFYLWRHINKIHSKEK